MEIYLIRHTQTETEKGLCYGRTDVPLAESFSEEAKAVHAKLPELEADALVFSSPLERCVKLAHTFAKAFSIDHRLQEIDFGAWENRRFDTIDAVLLKQWSEDFVNLSPPGGETFQEVYRRAAGFWDETIARPDVSQVFILTHAGVIRALLAYILPLPLANAFKFQINTGSVHKFRQENHYTYVDFVNH